MATTTETINVSADVYGDYTAVAVDGMKPGERAKQRGTTGSTVSANVKRVKLALDAGHTVNVDGDTAASGTAKLDPVAVARDMDAAHGPIIARDYVRITAERDKLDKQREALDVKLAQLGDELAGNADVAAAFKFDMDAFIAAITPEPEPEPEPTTEPTA